MVGGPFEHYPASVEAIDSAGQDLNGTAAPMQTVAHDAARRTAAASESTEGFLVPLFGAMQQPLWWLGNSLHEAAAWAGAIVRAWALAVASYNERIDQLNLEYAAAEDTNFGVTFPEARGRQSLASRQREWEQYDIDVANAARTKLAELRGRRQILEDELDQTADDLAGRLSRSPTEGDWQAFDRLGVLPDAFRQYLPPLPPEPEEDDDNPLVSLFKAVVFDPDQCGGDGSILGCGVEIAGIIPVGKVLKGGKLIKKGVDGADSAEDVAKHADEVIDAARAADKAEDAASAGLRELFQDGGTPKASELRTYAEGQGWTLKQTPDGPPKYVDENGVERMVIKRGSPRTPGSENPHVSLRDSSDQLIDAYGNPTTRKSPGNHTPIDWDLE